MTNNNTDFFGELLSLTKTIKKNSDIFEKLSIEMKYMSHEYEKIFKQIEFLIDGEVSESWLPTIQRLKGKIPRGPLTRESRTMTQLSIMIINSLRSGPKTRTQLADEVGFARQRVCSALAIIKGIGIVTEKGPPRGKIASFNYKQNSVICNPKKTLIKINKLKTIRWNRVQTLLKQLKKLNLNNFQEFIKKNYFYDEKEAIGLNNQSHITPPPPLTPSPLPFSLSATPDWSFDQMTPSITPLLAGEDINLHTEETNVIKTPMFNRNINIQNIMSSIDERGSMEGF